MELNINYKKKKNTVNNTNTCRLNNTFLNLQQVTEEIKREIKKKKFQKQTDNLSLHLKQLENKEQNKKLAEGKKS